MTLAAAVLLAPVPARAEVSSCKKAYEDQRFDEALQVCGKVAREPLSERPEVTAALEVVGMANLVLGRERPARVAFCQLLLGDPDYRPSDPIYPQRFVAVFDATRKAGCGPVLRLELDDASHHKRAAVRVRTRGPLPAVYRIGVFYRHVGDKQWRRELTPTVPSATVNLSKVSLADGDVEVVAAVLVDDDYAVARAGTVDRPRRLARWTPREAPLPPRRAPERERVPLWKRTWFWWAVAGVAATVIVVSASVAATRSNGPGGTLGPPLQLPLGISWR